MFENNPNFKTGNVQDTSGARLEPKSPIGDRFKELTNPKMTPELIQFHKVGLLKDSYPKVTS